MKKFLNNVLKYVRGYLLTLAEILKFRDPLNYSNNQIPRESWIVTKYKLVRYIRYILLCKSRWQVSRGLIAKGYLGLEIYGNSLGKAPVDYSERQYPDKIALILTIANLQKEMVLK